MDGSAHRLSVARLDEPPTPLLALNDTRSRSAVTAIEIAQLQPAGYSADARRGRYVAPLPSYTLYPFPPHMPQLFKLHIFKTYVEACTGQVCHAGSYGYKRPCNSLSVAASIPLSFLAFGSMGGAVHLLELPPDAPAAERAPPRTLRELRPSANHRAHSATVLVVVSVTATLPGMASRLLLSGDGDGSLCSWLLQEGTRCGMLLAQDELGVPITALLGIATGALPMTPTSHHNTFTSVHLHSE